MDDDTSNSSELSWDESPQKHFSFGDEGIDKPVIQSTQTANTQENAKTDAFKSPKIREGAMERDDLLTLSAP